jgi:hypothetical protein
MHDNKIAFFFETVDRLSFAPKNFYEYIALNPLSFIITPTHVRTPAIAIFGT